MCIIPINCIYFHMFRFYMDFQYSRQCDFFAHQRVLIEFLKRLHSIIFSAYSLLQYLPLKVIEFSIEFYFTKTQLSLNSSNITYLAAGPLPFKLINFSLLILSITLLACCLVNPHISCILADVIWSFVCKYSKIIFLALIY